MPIVQMRKLRICESLAQAADLGMQPIPPISALRVLSIHVFVPQTSTQPVPCPAQPDVLVPLTLTTPGGGGLSVTPKREQRSTEAGSLTQSHTVTQAGI